MAILSLFFPIFDYSGKERDKKSASETHLEPESSPRTVGQKQVVLRIIHLGKGMSAAECASEASSAECANE